MQLLQKPRNVLAVVCVAYLIALAFVYDDFGVNPDEGLHITNGEQVIRWYTSGFEAREMFAWTNLWAYGGAFDILCHAAVSVSPLSVYETRHMMTALFGLLGILGTYALGRAVGSEWTGVGAAILLVLTPRYVGHAFFNHKDIPFAVGYVWSLYGILACWRMFPQLSIRPILICGISIGFSLGLRIGGAILGFYLTLIAVCWLLFDLRERGWSPDRVRSVLITCLGAGALAYVLMLLVWPWVQLEPLTRPLWALSFFSGFGVVIPTLFEGIYYASHEIPWYYTLKWLVLTLPELTLVSCFGGLYLFGRSAVSDPRKAVPGGLVVFAFAFPLVYAAVKGVPFYNALRHVLFVLPLIAILSSCFLEYLFKSAAVPSRILVGCLAVVGLLMARDLFVFHPLQYTYFNRAIAGGIENAKSDYETDYYASSYKAGLDWIVENAPRTQRKVAAPGWLIIEDGPYDRVWAPEDADFYIGRYLTDEHLDVPGKIVHRVQANGTNILAVVKPDGRPLPGTAPNPSTASFFFARKAGHLSKSGKQAEMVESLERAVASQPYVQANAEWLARSYLEQGRWKESAETYASVTSGPRALDANLVKMGTAYHNLQDFEQAEKSYQRALDIRPDQYHALVHLSALYLGTGKMEQAREGLDRALHYYPGMPYPKLLYLRTLIALDDKDGAIEFATRTVDEHPEIKEAHSLKLMLLIEREDWGVAVGAANVAVKADPGRVNIWLVLARAYRELGAIDSARVALDQSVQMDPRSVEVLSEWRSLAEVLIGQRAFEMCAAMARHAIDSGVVDPIVWSYAGQALLGQGDFAAARGTYEQGIRAFPEDLDLRVGHAGSLIGQGATSQAREALVGILSVYPDHVESQMLLKRIGG